jgi:hypothetical protein
MPTCRSCGAPIIWATTQVGRPMPFDKMPADDIPIWEYKWTRGYVDGAAGDVHRPDGSGWSQVSFAVVRGDTCPLWVCLWIREIRT